MGYFNYSGVFPEFKHQDAWKSVLTQIHSVRVFERYPGIRKMQNPIEAKALHIFTFASRFLRSVDLLVKHNNGNWHLMFVETSVLLYPIVEMIGLAVMDKAVDAMKSSNRLAAGIYWLHDPTKLPSKVTGKDAKNDSSSLERVHRHMPADRGVSTLSTLYYLRHYYLHGLGRSTDVEEEHLIDYALPQGMAGAIEDGLYTYWKELQTDDGRPDGWLNRLAQSDIHPFKISGSNDFEEGLIDPGIVNRILGSRLREDRQ